MTARSHLRSGRFTLMCSLRRSHSRLRTAGSAHLRATCHVAAGIALGAEVLAIRGAIRGAQRGAIHGPQAQSLEGVACCVLLPPCLCRSLEQPRHRRIAQSLASLGDGTLADERGIVGQHQIETVDHLADRPMAVDRQGDNQPHHLLSRFYNANPKNKNAVQVLTERHYRICGHFCCNADQPAAIKLTRTSRTRGTAPCARPRTPPRRGRRPAAPRALPYRTWAGTANLRARSRSPVADRP